MGCSTCGKQGVTTFTPQPYVAPQLYTAPLLEECDYTIAQLNVWLTKLICCKDSGLYLSLGLKASNVNKYLGIVMSAINYVTYPCFFKKDLDIIANVIISIENTGKC